MFYRWKRMEAAQIWKINLFIGEKDIIGGVVHMLLIPAYYKYEW